MLDLAFQSSPPSHHWLLPFTPRRHLVSRYPTLRRSQFKQEHCKSSPTTKTCIQHRIPRRIVNWTRRSRLFRNPRWSCRFPLWITSVCLPRCSALFPDLTLVLVYVAWDIINGTTDSAFQSALQLTIHPLTPPPQAPTLQPDSMFRAYIHRLITTTAVSQSVVVVALFYLYKARAHLQRLLIMGDVVDQTMAYGMCAASLMLGNKFLDDNTYTSRTWATLSGYTLWEINDCERKLLQALDFQLNITLPEYNEWWRILSEYKPSEVGPFNHTITNNPPTSRPLTAESWAPIMPVNRRLARVETSSRPASRKRSRADDELELPNKRSVVSMPSQHPLLPSSQAVAYQTATGLAYGQQLSAATVPEQLPLHAYPFAFGNGGVMQVSRIQPTY